MIVPFILLLISSVGMAATVLAPGFADLIVLAVPCVAASLLLLIHGLIAKRRQTLGSAPHADAGVRKRRSRFWQRRRRYVVVDGSNVLHWKDGKPQLDTLREVVRHLKKQGYTPGVVFDANAGHILTGKYQHHSAMAKLLDLPQDRVMVVDKGVPADPTILAAAQHLTAQIVTNDRYRDWAETYPEVHTPGHLIRGRYLDGQLHLDLGADALGQPSGKP